MLNKDNIMGIIADHEKKIREIKHAISIVDNNIAIKAMKNELSFLEDNVERYRMQARAWGLL